MGIENCELYTDDAKMSFVSDTYGQIREQAYDVAAQIQELSNMVNSCTSWKRNGKEECGAFLELMTSFGMYIADSTYKANIGGSSSALSSKNVTGGAAHMEKIKKAVDEFWEESIEMERGGSARSVVALDTIQGD